MNFTPCKAGLDARPLRMAQGDTLIYGGDIAPLPGGSISGVVVTAQIQTPANSPHEKIDLAVTLTGPDENGVWTYAIREDDTTAWPVGAGHVLAVRAFTTQTGWQTVARRPLAIEPPGYIEVTP